MELTYEEVRLLLWALNVVKSSGFSQYEQTPQLIPNLIEQLGDELTRLESKLYDQYRRMERANAPAE